MKKIPPLTEKRSFYANALQSRPGVRMKVDLSQSQGGPPIGKALAFVGNDVDDSMGRVCRLDPCFFDIMWEVGIVMYY